MHKTLHPKEDINRLYMSRKEGGRGLARIEDSLDTSIKRFEEDIKNGKKG